MGKYHIVNFKKILVKTHMKRLIANGEYGNTDDGSIGHLFDKGNILISRRYQLHPSSATIVP
jgi:hypothetical protein